MNWRYCRWACLGIIFSSFALGCGYSETEWQGKLKEIDGLKTSLQKSDDDFRKASQQVDSLKDQLKKINADVDAANATLADKQKALEDYRRRAEQLDAIKKRFEMLRNKLQALTAQGLVVEVRNNLMVVRMPGDVLFESGKVDLKKNGKEILVKVAEVIRGDEQLSKRMFQVAGHTDSKPLSGGPYKDNWGLSVMRAREVLIFLIGPMDKGGGGLAPKLWSAAGYGDTVPIALGDAPDAMQKNRRVELVVVPGAEELLDMKSLAQ